MGKTRPRRLQRDYCCGKLGNWEILEERLHSNFDVCLALATGLVLITLSSCGLRNTPIFHRLRSKAERGQLFFDVRRHQVYETRRGLPFLVDDVVF